MILLSRIFAAFLAFSVSTTALSLDELSKYDDVKYSYDSMVVQKKLILEHALHFSWKSETQSGAVNMGPEHLDVYGLGTVHDFEGREDNYVAFGMQVVLLNDGHLLFQILEGKMGQQGMEILLVAETRVDPKDANPFRMEAESDGSGASYVLTLENRASVLPGEGYAVNEKIEEHRVLLEGMQPMRDLTENYSCLIQGDERDYGLAPDYVRVHGVHIGVPRVGQNLSIGHHSVFDGRDILMPWIPLEFQVKVQDGLAHFIVFEVPPHVKKVSPAELGKLSHETVAFTQQESFRIEIPSQISNKQFALQCDRQ